MHSFLGHKPANVEVFELELVPDVWWEPLMSPLRGHIVGQGAQEMLGTSDAIIPKDSMLGRRIEFAVTWYGNI